MKFKRKIKIRTSLWTERQSLGCEHLGHVWALVHTCPVRPWDTPADHLWFIPATIPVVWAHRGDLHRWASLVPSSAPPKPGGGEFNTSLALASKADQKQEVLEPRFLMSSPEGSLLYPGVSQNWSLPDFRVDCLQRGLLPLSLSVPLH